MPIAKNSDTELLTDMHLFCILGHHDELTDVFTVFSLRLEALDEIAQ